jgi:hypothetical protein
LSVELVLAIFRRMPCYWLPAEMSGFVSRLDPAGLERLWQSFRELLEQPDDNLADPLAYTLAVEYFEMSWPEAWEALAQWQPGGAFRRPRRGRQSQDPRRPSPSPREAVQCVAAARQPLDEREREAGVAKARRRLGQQPPDPTRRCPVKARIAGLGKQDENCEGIIEPDRRQLGGGRLDDVHVACRQSTLKSAVG